MEPNPKTRQKRFRLVKLEERIVPSHLPAVAEVIVASPAVEHAPTHAHKVDFKLSGESAAGFAAACKNFSCQDTSCPITI
jgi:hypothetical protein